ncbi:MAG: amino acid adenylation domain-containing protein [Anaerolineaceae bacterium]|nr:amino acid adenylation domain-containing protein [Anaerolineaceae bacterium]
MNAQEIASFEKNKPDSEELDETLRQRQSIIASRCFHPQNGFAPFERTEIEQSIGARFEKQVARDPHHLAVVTEGQSYTYDQINRAANRIARAILEKCGPKPAPVALLLEHGAPTIMAIFGVLKGGKIYVALDPAFPEARTSFIVADSQAELIVTNQANYAAAAALAQGDESRLLNIDTLGDEVADDNLALDISPDTVAYILYTSGSTGQPKGVYQNHRNLLHEIMQYTNTLHLSPHDRFTLVYSCSVNGSLRDIFGALLIGASVHSFDVKTKGLADLASWMQREEITFYHSVPTVFRHFIDGLLGGETFPQLRLIRFGGERVPTQYIDWYKQFFPDSCILYAGMGATETSTTRQCFIDKETVIRDSVVPTGYAVDERPILLLDENGRPVPEGEVGTITVKSRYLALGYWRRPDLTTERFRPDPDGSDARLYLTGDLGRILADGRLIHMGREDAQVKIRGHRVELAEIEQTLLKHPGVKEAAVAAHPDGQNGHYLAAYAVAHPGQNITTTELYKFFKQNVPDYMMPAAFVFLGQMPLTPNSKVDRKSLPVPELTRPALATPFEPPTTAVETELAHIWSTILRVDPIGILDNFFELGGHSLSATQVISRLQERFQIAMPFHAFFAEPTIAALAQQINQASASTADTPLPRLPREADGPTIAPASYSQQRLWFLEQLDPGKATFNLPLVLVLNGRLHTNALQHAIDQLVARHETLRTTFFTEEGELRQRIQPAQAVPWEWVDLQQLPPAARRQAANEQLYAATYHTFDLVNGPLLRVTLYRLSETEHWLLIAMHHIVTDGWSVGLMQTELTELYRAAVANQPANLPELPVQYADFAAWQHSWLTTPEAAHQLSYWKQQLAGMPPALALPTDHPRPVQSTGQGAQRRFDLPTGLVQQLNQLSQAEAATPYMTLLTAFVALLHRYSGQDDLVMGTTIANRTRADIEPLIGFFLNSLVLRTDLSGQPTFRELLSRVRQTTLDAFANQQIPVEKLIESLNPSRQGHNLPLFQVLFIYQNMPRPTLDWPDLKVTRRRLDLDVTKFDLTLTVIEQDNGLQCLFEYNSDLFEAATIERLFGQMQTLLSHVVQAPTTAVSHLHLLTPPQTAELLTLAEGPQLPPPPFTAVPQWFEAQVEKSGRRTAVTHLTHTLTYAQLNQRANQLARHLQKQGVTANRIVGLCLHRSTDMLVALLGILKAGGAYLPLDPAYPTERLALMLEDAQVQTIVTQNALVGLLPQAGASLVCIDQDWPQIAQESAENLGLLPTPEDLAYIIYTSGSTGKPKGVMIPHRALTQFTQAASHLYGVTASDRMLQFATINFDAAVEEIFPTLVQGGTLCLRTDEMLNSMEAFLAQATAYEVTMLDLPTAFWHQLVTSLAEDRLALPTSLRLLIIGGEKASGPKVADWHRLVGDTVRLFNTYGPTEATVVATAYELPADGVPQLVSQGMPIGRPLANGQALVLDAQQKPVPVGVPGELVLGGPQVALGYLHQPALTADVFIPHPFRTGETVYRTGDQVRWLPDGNLEFWGRVDDQVKIRGFRIEPGEIERALASHPAIREVCVLAREDAPGQKRLAAYLVAAPEAELPAIGDLRAFLKESLPDYMVPAAFMFLDALPLSNSGKINRRALPLPELQRDEQASYLPPRTETEATLAAVWAEVLGLPRVGVADNYFDLGGDSILSIRLLAKARQAGLEIALPDLFRYQTIAALAPHVGAGQADAARTEPFQLIPEQIRAQLPEDVMDAYPLSRLQAGMLYHSKLEPDTAVYFNVTIKVVRAVLDEEKMRATLALLGQRHPILRTSYHLGEYAQPLQLVHETAVIPLQVDDLRSLSPAEQATIRTAWLAAEHSQHFNWETPPLLRFQVHRLTDDTFQLAMSVHHVILDGWSEAALISEFFQIYTAQLGANVAPIPPAPVAQFRDFIAAEKAAMANEEHQRYWSEQISDAPLTQIARWPNANAQEGEHLDPMRSHLLKLPTEVVDGLLALAKESGVHIKHVFLAAHLYVMGLVSGENDVVTGLVSNGRLEQTDGERTLGLFLNTIPFRQQLTGGTWADLVRQTFSTEQELLPHRRFPLVNIRQMRPGQDLFETIFNFIHFRIFGEANQLAGLEILKNDYYGSVSDIFSLDVFMNPVTAAVNLVLDYSVTHFPPAQIEAIAGYYWETLTQMAREPQANYATFSALSAAERSLVVDTWNQTEAAFPAETCVHKLIAQQAAQTPEATAVLSQNQTLTYGELVSRANQLAHYLQTLGVGPDTIVGISVGRVPDLIVGLLGILTAGGAYLPLDPEYPQDRLAYMLEDAQTPVLLTTAALANKLPQTQAKLIKLDSDWPTIAQQPTIAPASQVTPDNLAYIIYTSGSTGKPKGVLLPHRAMMNHNWYIGKQLFKLQPADRALQFSTINFDVAVEEIFPTLLCGSTLVLSPTNVLTAAEMVTLLNQYQVTILNLPTAYWQLLVREMVEHSLPVPASLRLAAFGGEAIMAPAITAWHELDKNGRVTLINGYGPTETTVTATDYHIQPQDGTASNIPIGKPIANTRTYVLNAQHQPVPIGVPGELYIGGRGVARGYLRQPERTAQAFLPDPFANAPNARMYKTGDLVRWLPDGNIEFIGRTDHQVKLRGFRIELGEIETALLQLPEIQEALVLLWADEAANKHLVAYYLARETAVPHIADLKARLQTTLPEYMVPTIYMQLAEWPLTPNGKIDRKALPAPDPANVTATQQAYAPPNDPIENQLVDIWESVLQVKPIGIYDNYFDLGGHSLQTIVLFARIERAFAVEIPLATIIQAPTIAQLAQIIRETGEETTWSSLVPISPTGQERPFFCVHGGAGHVYHYRGLAKYLGPEQPFFGLQPANRSGTFAGNGNVTIMAQDYVAEIRKVQPTGPYYLGGFCFGGLVAFEMAQQLRQAGEKVALVAIIDAVNPEFENGPPKSAQPEGSWWARQKAAFGQQKTMSDKVTYLRKVVRRRLRSTFVEPAIRKQHQKAHQEKMQEIKRYEASGQPLPLDLRDYRNMMATDWAQKHYKPQPYDSDLVVLRRDEDWEGIPNDMGWGLLTTAQTHVYRIPGGHMDILQEPNVQDLARLLQKGLESSRKMLTNGQNG